MPQPIAARVIAVVRAALPQLFDSVLLKGLGPHLKARAGPIAVCLAAAAAQPLLSLPMIPLVRLAFDQAIPKGDIPLLCAIGLGLAITRLAVGAATVFTRFAVVGIKTDIALILRRDLLARLYDRPHISHVRAENQPFAAHLVIDVDRIDATLDQVLGSALPGLFGCLLLGGAMIYLNPVLVGVGLLFLPVIWIVGRVTTLRMRANIGRYHEAHDGFIRGVRFVLDNFALTRSRGAESAEIERQTAGMRTLREATVHLAVDNTRGGQFQSLAVALVGTVIMVAGGLAVGRHAMTMGSLLAFFLAGGLAAGQIDRLISTLPVVVEGLAALGRLDAHLRSAPSPPYRGRRLLDWRGHLELEDVDFAYGETPLLRQVSLAIEPGASIGLIGPNGAGKTTILSLIQGLYRPDTGRLTADGVDYGDLDLRAIRRRIGLVPQDPRFFDGDLFENIAYGAPEVTRKHVEALVEQLGAGRLLAALPGGLKAPLGETGLLLSGGQRQMVAILRALAIQPRLLVLDEPTNHLDQVTVEGLMGSVTAIMPSSAILVISHVPSVVAGVDRLFRLNGGRLARVVNDLG